ncbi:MAG: TetR/AcrR family transcriptional regulator [Actinobacteria bacterium]|nr:TetR/AcrR family transcriptional regulator [Actinomycetota bacterium]
MTTTGPRQDVRAALLEGARDELAEHGRAGISLRAVARRVGVSHAAPKHHFGDRAGLLTAIAAEGFDALTAALVAAEETAADEQATPEQRINGLGRAYVDYGLRHPALFDLMFRPAELHQDDPELARAQAGALSALSSAAAAIAPTETAPSGIPVLALTSWALAHGLVVLARDGALQGAAGADPTDLALPLELIGQFGRVVRGEN